MHACMYACASNVCMHLRAYACLHACIESRPRARKVLQGKGGKKGAAAEATAAAEVLHVRNLLDWLRLGWLNIY